ncbi:DUF6615 family protein [Saccharicrinis sp. FJH54]|uniref:DUF6615 family protein n=1 Tax=Saccharicrinis sp. FJH54 TaxID=3344665 RepID=UPI0035D4515E
MSNLIANDLCIAFKAISARTWNSMHKNFITPIQKREDAFTSDNLQDLYLMNSDFFRVFDFSPHVESSTTGADWEMWFVDSDGKCFGFAVQAKKLSKDLDYEIGYVPNNGYPQIDRLFDYCRQTNDLTPLYCFYNYFDKVNSTCVWPCKSYPEDETLWGCAISHGVKIKNLNNLRRNTINDILPVSFPWHCLVCCPGINRNGLGTYSDRAAGFADLLKTMGDENEKRIENNSDFENPKIQDSLPKRIQVLLDYDNGIIPKQMVDEIWGKLKPKQIMIIYENKASR